MSRWSSPDVHLAQRVDHGQEQLPRRAERDAAPVLGEILLEGLAVQVRHDQIPGAVGREEVPHLDDAELVLELAQHAGLGEEPLEPGGEFLPGAPGAGGHGMVRIARRQSVREVLLDRDPCLEHGVPADVRDAESALAQRAARQVPAVQQRARRQGVGRPGRRAVHVAAGRAVRRGAAIGHASHAQVPVLHHAPVPARSAHQTATAV